jgi:hypothetical protein
LSPKGKKPQMSNTEGTEGGSQRTRRIDRGTQEHSQEWLWHMDTLGSFRAVGERKERRSSGSGAGGHGSGARCRFFCELRRGFRIGSGDRKFVFNDWRVCFYDAMNVLIRNFPAEIVEASALFDVLFEKDRPSRISHENARGREKNIADTVIDGDFAPEKSCV